MAIQMHLMAENVDSLSAAELRRLYTTQSTLLRDFISERFLWSRVVLAAAFFLGWFLALYGAATGMHERATKQDSRSTPESSEGESWATIIRPFWFSPLLLSWMYIVAIYFGVRLMGRRSSAFSAFIFEFLFIYNFAQMLANVFVCCMTFAECRRLQGSPSLFSHHETVQTYGGLVLQPVIGPASPAATSAILGDAHSTKQRLLSIFTTSSRQPSDGTSSAHGRGNGGLFGVPFALFTQYVAAPCASALAWPLQRLFVQPILVSLLGLNVEGYFAAWWGNGKEFRSPWLACMVWLHYMLHVTELVDILFVVLRKKYHRILTGLHVYLRLLNLWSWFLAARYGGYGDMGFVIVCNSGTNAIVYAYYARAVLFPDDSNAAAKKNRVVKVQIWQMTCLLLHSVWGLFFGRMPAFACLWQGFVMSQGLMLYLDFQAQDPANPASENDMALAEMASLAQAAANDGLALKRRASAVLQEMGEKMAAGGRHPAHFVELDTNLPPDFSETESHPATPASSQGDSTGEDDASEQGSTSAIDDAASPAAGGALEVGQQRRLVNSVSLPNFLHQKSDSPPADQQVPLTALPSRNRKPQLMFSFDSSGWLYLYHFGVAYAIERRFGRLTEADLEEYNAYEDVIGRMTNHPYSMEARRGKEELDFTSSPVSSRGQLGRARFSPPSRLRGKSASFSETQSPFRQRVSQKLALFARDEEREPRPSRGNGYGSPGKNRDGNRNSYKVNYRTKSSRNHEDSDSAHSSSPDKNGRPRRRSSGGERQLGLRSAGALGDQNVFGDQHPSAGTLFSSHSGSSASLTSADESGTTAREKASYDLSMDPEISERTPSSGEDHRRHVRGATRGGGTRPQEQENKSKSMLSTSNFHNSIHQDVSLKLEHLIRADSPLGTATTGVPTTPSSVAASVEGSRPTRGLGGAASSRSRGIGRGGNEVQNFREDRSNNFYHLRGGPEFLGEPPKFSPSKFASSSPVRGRLPPHTLSKRAAQTSRRVNPASLGFSGSSGGALVGGALATGIDIKALADYAISLFPLCGRNPPLAMKALDWAMGKFMEPNMHRRANNRLRVLLTKVRVTKPPFFTAQIVSEFSTTTHLKSCLKASSHVPIAAGVLPFRMDHAAIHGRKEEISPVLEQSATGTTSSSAKKTEWYIDGLAWLTFLVPWRTFHPDDSVVKVSALSAPTADIVPRIIIPFWWVLFPPSDTVLKGIFWSGYQDAEAFFRDVKLGHKRRGPLKSTCLTCSRDRESKNWSDAQEGYGSQGRKDMALNAKALNLGSEMNEPQSKTTEDISSSSSFSDVEQAGRATSFSLRKTTSAAQYGAERSRNAKRTAEQVLRKLLPKKDPPALQLEDPELWAEIMHHVEAYEEIAEYHWVMLFFVTACVLAFLLFAASYFDF
ncbi:unnamed protein product [Amoebophrya sp. A25]|nr:unnamed protein product [Amoebophrya sp. A25]|eukprot:GSA25T00013121001.1